MKTLTFTVAVMAAGLLVAAPAFAQTTPAQKQKTQESGPSFAPEPCGLPYNANSAADPNCNSYKQHTQNLSPSPAMDASAKPK